MERKESVKKIITVCAIVLGILFLIIIMIAGIINANKPTISNNDTLDKQSVYTKTETLKQSIDYDTITVDDPNLEYGKTGIRVNGVMGEKSLTYEVIYENEEEKSRILIKEETTRQPVTRVIAKGTKIVWHCVDVTSFNKNPYDDNKCTSSTGEVVYASDYQSQQLDPSYSPGKSGNLWYNNK